MQQERQLEHHPQHKQGKKEKRLYTVIASFTTTISLTVCLPACPTYLCLNLSYQFFPHSPRLLVIAHHPLIERKGACSVNNLTNLLYMILSPLNTCLQIFSAINDSYTSRPGGRNHTLVYTFDALLPLRGILYKNAIIRVQNSWDENNKNVTTLNRAKPSEWWQGPWLSDKRASGFNTLLIRSIRCSQLTKLAKHQTSLWYRMQLPGIALIPGYTFSFHWCWAGVSQSFLLLLSALNIFFIFVFPPKKEPLHCCTAVSQVTAL